MKHTLDFIRQAHSGQERKNSGIPYWCHCVDVMSLLIRWGVKDADVLNAALCHDVVENSGDIWRDQMKGLIGDKSTAIVDELTWNPNFESKVAYLKSFVTKSPAAIVVKVADRVCNTLDFAGTESTGWARKYWRKAAVLADAIANNEAAITNQFGLQVIASIGVQVCQTEEWTRVCQTEEWTRE